MDDFLSSYKIVFSNSLINKDLPLPGEHHFVGTCLIPLLYTKNNGFFEKIEYLNPDGAKSINKNKNKNKKNNHKDIVDLYDLTFKRGQSYVGIEVKYSKDMSLKFTSTQLKQFFREGNKSFLGVLSLVFNKEKGQLGQKGPKIVFITSDNFRSMYGKHYQAIGKKQKTKSLKIEELTSLQEGWFELEKDNDFINILKNLEL